MVFAGNAAWRLQLWGVAILGDLSPVIPFGGLRFITWTQKQFTGRHNTFINAIFHTTHDAKVGFVDHRVDEQHAKP